MVVHVVAARVEASRMDLASAKIALAGMSPIDHSILRDSSYIAAGSPFLRSSQVVKRKLNGRLP